MLMEENNILANYQALPDDETFLEPSGIRMGVQEMTRFGMKEEDFDILSGYIADVVIENKECKEDVEKFRPNFLEMKYCLPREKAVSIAAKIITSVFPYPGFSEQFIQNLEQNMK